MSKPKKHNFKQNVNKLIILQKYEKELSYIEKLIEEWKRINLDDCYEKLKKNTQNLCLNNVNNTKYMKYFNNDYIKNDKETYIKAIESFVKSELNIKTKKLIEFILNNKSNLVKFDMYSNCKDTCMINYINLIEIWEVWLVNQNLFDVDDTVKTKLDKLVEELLTNENLKQMIKNNMFKPELLENIIIQVCNCVASNKYKIRFVYIGQFLNMFIQFCPDTNNMINGLTYIFNSIKNHNKQEIFKRCYANKSYEKPLDAFYRRIGCYIIKRDTTYKVTKTQLDKFENLLNENKTLFYEEKIHTKEDPFPLIFDVFVSTINKKNDYDRYLTINRLNIQFYNKFFQALYIKNVCDNDTKKLLIYIYQKYKDNVIYNKYEYDLQYGFIKDVSIKKLKSIVDSTDEGKFGYYILYCVYNNDNFTTTKMPKEFINIVCTICFYFMLNDIYFEDKKFLSFNNDHWHTLLWDTMSVINGKINQIDEEYKFRETLKSDLRKLTKTYITEVRNYILLNTFSSFNIGDSKNINDLINNSMEQVDNNYKDVKKYLTEIHYSDMYKYKYYLKKIQNTEFNQFNEKSNYITKKLRLEHEYQRALNNIKLKKELGKNTEEQISELENTYKELLQLQYASLKHEPTQVSDIDELESMIKKAKGNSLSIYKHLVF